MFGHRWLPWVNNPTPGSAPVTSTKQGLDQSSCCLSSSREVTCHRLCPVVVLSALCLVLLVSCAALSVLYRKSEGKNLPDYQSIYLTLTKTNTDLRKENEILKKLRARLDEETKVLNQTSAKLTSVNVALTSERSELKQQIMNLTAANFQLTQDYEVLLQHTSKQEEKKLNMSQTIKYLLGSNAQREEEKRRLSETSGLLRVELLRLKQMNQELEEVRDRFQEEIQSLSERGMELQEQKQNLSVMLQKEREETEEQERSSKAEMEQMVADVQSMNEAYVSLDLYCPVVNQKTKERICKKCDDNWKLFQTKCYYFSSRMLSWSSSRAWCRTQGGDLLIINSEQEQKFISEACQTVEQSTARLWIGLTDAEEEGDWRWVDGSKIPSDVQFWLSRAETGTEPDNWKLDDPLGEDCGHIDTSENPLKSWMDGSCKISYRWICEKNV